MIKESLDFSRFLIEHYKIPIRVVVFSILITSLFLTKPQRIDHEKYISESGFDIASQKEKLNSSVKYNDLFLLTTLSYKCGDVTKSRIIIDENGHGGVVRFGDEYFYLDGKLNKMSSVCSGIFSKYLTIGFFGRIHEMSQFSDILDVVSR